MHGALLAAALIGSPQVITVDRDNIEVTESCTLQFVDEPVADADGNGVVHIRAMGEPIVVQCAGRLHGAAPELTPDGYTGTGISIAGPDVQLHDATVSGFKIGIHAERCDRLVLAGADVSDNFRQRLKSTPAAEDSSDWLWPHDNDENQWITRYGAGICIEQSNEVTVRRCRARDVQNGIILDEVNRSNIVDNDCSFLSGWGLALWRSSGNTIRRNALDFCVRGYSHGVYNRGQDSAGLLMFEQCSENIIVGNSMTHGGDGIFAFAGKEALGAVNPRDDLDWYTGRGNNGNVMAYNDCSYAAAHGIELTFSFDNVIASNRIVGNAICGIWGGYSHRTNISGNDFRINGEAGYGLERGDINIEHGTGNWIHGNTMLGSTCGVHLWWDKDPAIFERPWARVNPTASRDNVIAGNSFTGLDVGLHLRRTEVNFAGDNQFSNVVTEVKIENAEPLRPATRADLSVVDVDVSEAPEPSPVGRRDDLAGREHIIMTEWGPYDWTRPLLQRVNVEPELTRGAAVTYRVYGVHGGAQDLTVVQQRLGDPNAERISEPVPQRIPSTTVELTFFESGAYRVELRWQTGDGQRQREIDEFVLADWQVRWFNSPCDPRTDAQRWRAAAKDVEPVRMAQLQLPYAGGGPDADDVGADHFGTIAATSLELPAGRWRLRTTSDDGIRVWMNDKLVIDDWTWHAPKQHRHMFTLDEPTQLDLRVEHFELDGYAVLDVALEPIELR